MKTKNLRFKSVHELFQKTIYKKVDVDCDGSSTDLNLKGSLGYLDNFVILVSEEKIKMIPINKINSITLWRKNESKTVVKQSKKGT